MVGKRRYFEFAKVLIESDWNLKLNAKSLLKSFKQVSIESDWNLKVLNDDHTFFECERINRIRLEFKNVHTAYFHQVYL